MSKTSHSKSSEPSNKKSGENSLSMSAPCQKQMGPKLAELQSKICKEGFYLNQHIDLRSRCLQESKRLIKDEEEEKQSQLFKKTFIELWPKFLNELKQQGKIDEDYFDNNFACSGQEAYHVVQIDLLKLMLKKPIRKFAQKSFNRNIAQTNIWMGDVMNAKKQTINKKSQSKSIIKQQKQSRNQEIDNQDSKRNYYQTQKKPAPKNVNKSVKTPK